MEIIPPPCSIWHDVDRIYFSTFRCKGNFYRYAHCLHFQPKRSDPRSLLRRCLEMSARAIGKLVCLVVVSLLIASFCRIGEVMYLYYQVESASAALGEARKSNMQKKDPQNYAQLVRIEREILESFERRFAMRD